MSGQDDLAGMLMRRRHQTMSNDTPFDPALDNGPIELFPTWGQPTKQGATFAMPMFDQAGPQGFTPAARQFDPPNAAPWPDFNVNALRDSRQVPKMNRAPIMPRAMS